MENKHTPHDFDPHYQHARALSLSVGAIRKAQGKKNPTDFTVGTIEWHAAVEDFAEDVLRALMAEPDLLDVQSMLGDPTD